jgi:hypothetical protein
MRAGVHVAYFLPAACLRATSMSMYFQVKPNCDG